jgi:hypothetical protein
MAKPEIDMATKNTGGAEYPNRHTRTVSSL